MTKQFAPDQTVCRNRKALYRFEVLENLECGIVLRGTEVKSLREKNASIEEAYARIDGDELWLIGAHIALYKFGHTQSHEPLRRRKLLIHITEIRKLKHKVDQKGFTLVPLAVYFNNRGLAKVSLGLVRGKKFADKRRDLQTREHKREIDRGMRRKK